MKDLLLKSIKDINLIAVIIVAICYYYTYNLADTDFWSRLYCGSEYISHGWVLYKDIFSFVETKPLWVDHEWLSGVIFFYSVKLFGQPGILLLKYFFVILELLLIYFCIRQRSDTNINILFLLIIMFGLAPAFLSNLRPHCFTYLLFTFWFLILDHSRINDTTKYLWILPLTIPLWVNLHAGCIAGIALVGVFAFSQFIEKKTVKPYLLIIPASVLLMLVNPYTYHYFGYIYAELASSHDAIMEWEPVRIFSWTAFAFFKIMILLTIIAFTFAKDQKVDPVAIVLLIVFAFFGIFVARHNILFMIVAGIFVYERLHKIYMQLKEKALKVRSEKFVERLDFLGRTGFAFFVIVLFLPTLIALRPAAWKLAAPAANYPINSVQFLKENKIKGNMLLPFMWGGYVTWMLYPDILVSVDGRHVEIYPLRVFEENNDFYYHRKGWDKLLKQYKVDVLMLDRISSPVYKVFKNSDEWKLVYKDNKSAIFLPVDYPDLNSLLTPDLIPSKDINHFDSYFMK